MPNQKQAEPGSSLYLAQSRHTTAKARQEELKLQRIEGTLVERAAVERAQFTAGRQVRERFKNLPARMSGILAAESDQAKVFALLTKEIQSCLEGLTSSSD